jgi:uncharacterized protein (DUF488 family)
VTTTLWTIGYESATVPRFLETLAAAGIEVVADVRAVAGSRRPGFAKTRLAAGLAEAGIGYVHLRGLGTPPDGRAAARAGRNAELRRIYLEHLETPGARADLERLADLLRSGRRTCILCLEADPERCHRSMVAAALADRDGVGVLHLDPGPPVDPD